MNKQIVFAICGCLFFINGYSQTKSVEELLNEIAQNNTELKAYQSFIESRQLEHKSENNLPDPQLSGYYLPFGDNTTDAYTEYQILQSFEFPTVYGERRKWNALKSQQLNTAFVKRSQEILLQATTNIIEVLFLIKKKEIEINRNAESEQVYKQIQELYTKEQVGILDLNKAKIAWIQKQFVVEQIESDIQIVLSKLSNLNGGNPIARPSSEMVMSIEMGSVDQLWQEKLIIDPLLQELKANESLSFQNIKLEKNKVLPNLAFGYNYQGIQGSNYAGFYGGISIPLWRSKNKVKAAQANYEYQQSNTKVVTTALYLQFQETFKRYQRLLKKFKAYQLTLSELKSEALLFKAYTLGELSFMDYYIELQFYQKASDEMLQMEKELQLHKAQLLKHKL